MALASRGPVSTKAGGLPDAIQTVFTALENIDQEQLAQFQAGMRKRYSDTQILAQLSACAERLGKSPTMREFEADAETTVHPQTVIEHFGSWNTAKRKAGLVPRRFATREELLDQLRALARRSAACRPPRTSRPPRPDAIEVALLAHLRIAHDRPARGRVRRRGGRGAARPRARPGRASWRSSSAACRSSPTGPRRGAPTSTCSPSGRSTACSTRAAVRGRPSSSCSASASSSRNVEIKGDGTLA